MMRVLLTFWCGLILSLASYAQVITKGEYFIDTDPGVGNGTTLLFSGSNPSISFRDDIDLSGIELGFHTLSIRFKSDSLGWGHTTTRPFRLEKGSTKGGVPIAQPLEQAEYFIDTDPGVGNGTALFLSETDSLVSLFDSLDLTSVEPGFHTFSIRFKTTTAGWGHTTTRPFRLEKGSTKGGVPIAQPLEQAEYFIDTDPGVGNGTALFLSENDSLVSLFDSLDLTDVEPGFHTFSIRFKTTIAGWGHTITRPFRLAKGGIIKNPLKNPPPIIAAEFYVDSLDPGLGKARAIPITNPDSVIQASIAVAVSELALEVGKHIIFARVLDSVGTWSVDYSQEFEISDTITAPPGEVALVGINAPLSGCALEINEILEVSIANFGERAQTGFSVAYIVQNDTIIESIGNLVIPAGDTVQYAFQQKVNFSQEGTYSVRAYTRLLNDLNTGNDTLVASIDHFPSFSINVSENTTICEGDSITLTVDGGIAYEWSTGATTSSITARPQQTRNYTVTASNAFGCIKSETIRVTVTPISTWYADSDNDGFGNAEVIQTSCEQPLGYVSNGLDCDDADASINPDALEIPNDGIDQNCDGLESAIDLVIDAVTINQTNVTPGDSLAVLWEVGNLGLGETPLRWIERIYIQSSGGGNRILLVQRAFEEQGILASGQILNRNLNVRVPGQLTIGDEGVMVVEVIPDNSITETDGSNNIGIQTVPWSVTRLLAFNANEYVLTEGSGKQRVVLSRSGSLANALLVTLTPSSARFNLPEAIEIPSGKAATSFELSALDNNLLEGTLIEDIIAEAIGYNSATANLNLLDDEQPSLSIESLPTEANEGDEISFKVSTDLAAVTPTTVYLTSSNSERLLLPNSISIDAGSSFTEVSVTIPENNLPELAAEITINAGAKGYLSTSDSLLLVDDDIPELSLVIDNQIISETAGPIATYATLFRNGGDNTTELRADITTSTSRTLTLPRSIILPSGITKKRFAIGVIDNSSQEGDREVEITASVFVQSCGCTTSSLSNGSVTNSLTILDNEVPALTISSRATTLGEGLENAGFVRIFRNTSTDVPLDLILSSSDTSEAIVPLSTTIPVGFTFIDVPITTKDDGEEDGNQQVYITATADGLSLGRILLVVTDKNIPDLQVTASISNPVIERGGILIYELNVENTGLVTTPRNAEVYGYLSFDDKLDPTDFLFTLDSIKEPILANQSVGLSRTREIPEELPPLDYNLLFLVNPTGSIVELLNENNTSPAYPITINSGLTFTANVEEEYFIRGSSISIHGTAIQNNGAPAKNEELEVFILNNGFRRTLTAITDEVGAYQVKFNPLEKEFGTYEVGVNVPISNSNEVKDSFEIIDVQINDGRYLEFIATLNDTIKGNIKVENLGTLTLQDFTISPISPLKGVQLIFDTLENLAGNSIAMLSYTMIGEEITTISNYEIVQANVESSVGKLHEETIFYYCQSQFAELRSEVNNLNINVSVTKKERIVTFEIYNNGGGATGNIFLDLPNVDWLSAVSPLSLPNLNPGDTTIVKLRFEALPEVPLDVPITGSLVLNPDNGRQLSMPFEFKKVTNSTGSIEITATNAFTYYEEGEPKVEGALVRIENLYTGQLYGEGVTDSTGILVLSGIPEGEHKLIVEKEQHKAFNGRVSINPADTVEYSAFLNYQAITFNWSVVPTGLEDEYDISLVAEFETNVPVPVVTLEMPEQLPALTGNQFYNFDIVLTNHGLITANEVVLTLPEDPEYEFITNYQTANLLAQQSIRVPVIMRRRDINSIPNQRNTTTSNFGNGLNTSTGSCVLVTNADFWFTCNINTGIWERVGGSTKIEDRTCNSSDAGGGISGSITAIAGSGGINYPDFQCVVCDGSGGPSVSIRGKKITELNCRDCIVEVLDALNNCIGFNLFDIPIDPFEFTELEDPNDDIDISVPDDLKKYLGVVIEVDSAFSRRRRLGRAIRDGLKRWKNVVKKFNKLQCVGDIIGATATCAASMAFNNIRKDRLKQASTNRSIIPSVTLPRNSESSDMGGQFIDITENLELSRDYFQASFSIDSMFFGNLTLSNALDELAPLIETYFTDLDSISIQEQDGILAQMIDYELSQGELQEFFVYWNTSVYARSQGINSPNAQYPLVIDWNFIAANEQIINDIDAYAISEGFSDFGDFYAENLLALEQVLTAGQSDVCASVSVQFDQNLTMTREAFEGTLDIFNGHPTAAMGGVEVNVEIRDAFGNPSNGLFEIQTIELDNISDITGIDTIAAQQNAIIKFQFIPEIGAAPTEPTQYLFGGFIRYFDPFFQDTVTFPFSNELITVNPSPNLELHYFIQRNILGDDALTPDVIEPSLPAELSVMVENRGFGPAVNMFISSAQPEIVENEKGLAIEFELIGSNFQGEPTSLGLTDINFGTIPASETRVGQWFFTSSLLGKFISYSAEVTHANSFGNPELSLVQGIEVHELVKSIRAYGNTEDAINDFLVNDVVDVNDAPDRIYFSEGNRTASVNLAEDGGFNDTVNAPSFTNTVTITPETTGWNYIKLDDPTNNRFNILSVTRDDGQKIPLENVWLSFVTLPPGGSPLYEDKFHLLDTFPNENPITYTIVWEPKNEDVPEIVKVEGIPENIAAEQIKQITVHFNKSINADSFTFEDLRLTFQGSNDLLDNTVTITQIDTASFLIDLSSKTVGNGFYSFTVQAAEIQDIYGISGTVGKQFTWTQYITVPAVQEVIGLPENNRVSSVPPIQLLFNLPLNVSSINQEDFIVLKDSVEQGGSIKIDSVSLDARSVYLSGLDDIINSDGIYALRVDLSGIRTTEQIPGVGQQAFNILLDRVGPKVEKISTSTKGGLDAQHVLFIDVEFDEEVSNFTTGSLLLERNGERIDLRIDQLSNIDLRNWRIGTLGLLAYLDGEYQLTVRLNNIKDALGNLGVGETSISWTVDRSAKVVISNLSINPDLGFSDSDGITSGNELGVSFDLNVEAEKVAIIQQDVSSEIALTNLSNVSAGKIEVPVTFTSGSNTTLKVVATGSNGGQSMVAKKIFIDRVPLAAVFQELDNVILDTQLDSVEVSFNARLLNENDILQALSIKRNGIELNTSSLGYTIISDSTYVLYEIKELSSIPGIYELTLDLTLLKKYSSGIAGEGAISTAWIVDEPLSKLVAMIGNIQLEGRPIIPSSQWQVPLTINLFKPDQSLADSTLSIVTDTVGNFIVESIREGAFVISVKNSHTLQNARAVNVEKNMGVVGFGALSEGDANNDNLVGLTDFSILASSFNLGEGEENFDERADFNEDAIVSLLDFSLLATNFNKVGYFVDENSYEDLRNANTRLASSIPRAIDQEVNLDISFENSFIQKGDTAIFTVFAITEDLPVDAAEVHLSYDHNMLEVISLNTHQELPALLLSDFDNTNGTIKYAAGTFTNLPQGEVRLFTVEAIIRDDAAETTINFENRQQGRTMVTYQGHDVLGETKDGLLQISGPLGCETCHENEIDISIYPNPSRGKYAISIEGIDQLVNVKAWITDLSGIEIKSVDLEDGNSTEIDISEAVSGIYLLNIQIKDMVKVVKLLKY